MRLKLADVPSAAATEFTGESFVFDFKDSKVNPDVTRLYLAISGDEFKLSYKDVNDKHYYVKHNMKTFIPNCSTFCSHTE